MSPRPKISIFLSSPTDVQSAREAAERVVARLGGVYDAHVELALERWERRYYEASKGFQEAIAAMDAFDLVVGVLWKRIGSELPPDRFRRPDGIPFESGTVYELETALAASRRSGRPAVYVFKSSHPVTYTAERVDEERTQKEALDTWWARTFRDAEGHYVAAVNEFDSFESFEAKFEDFLVGWLEQQGYIPSGPVWDIETQGSPYPGLLAYNYNRSSVFFGRQLAVEHARDELLAADKRVGGLSALLIIGASGSGKSSLARAGLVPKLTRPGAVAGIDLWRTVVTMPTDDSLVPLAAQLYAFEGLRELAAGAQPGAERWVRMAAGSPEAAADSIAWALDRVADVEARRTGADRKLQARLLLVVDQLESLFGTPGQKAFAKVLRALVEGERVWLVATLRSDRYPELLLDPDLLAIKRAGATYDLPPPGPAEIADIVKGPARAAGLTFAERDGRSLAHELIEAVPNADALPLLQMALKQLFERRHGAEMAFTDYEAMGGVEGAIAAHANSVFAQVDLPAAQRELDPLVREIVHDVGRTSDGQIRFTTRAASRKDFETTDARRTLVRALVEGRLLVSDGDNLRVAHEALLRRWDRAKESLERLADAVLRRARIRVLLASAAAVVFLMVAAAAFVQRQEAQYRTEIAVEQKNRATTALAQRLEADTARLAQSARRQADEGLPEVGIQLALAALASDPEVPAPPPSRWRAVDALAWSISAGPLRLAVLRHEGRIFPFPAAFSPDGQKVLTTSMDHTVRLWDTVNGRELLVLQHEDAVNYASFSPDGQKVLTAMKGGPTQLWDAVKGIKLATSHWHEGEYFSAFSPDRQKILTRSENGPARLRDADDGRELLVIQPDKPVYHATFSPDGRKVLTTSADGNAQLWDAANGAELAGFAHQSALHGTKFSPDGQKILMAFVDGTVRVWDAVNGTELLILRHNGQLLAAAFSPDGQKVLTASNPPRQSFLAAPRQSLGAPGIDLTAILGGTARVWDAVNGRELLALRHERAVYSAVFSTDGQKILTGSGDGTARLWDAGSGRQLLVLQTGKPVGSALFSPDGQKVLTIFLEDTAELWDINTTRELLTLRHQQPVWRADFSPDGQKVLTTSGDGAARLWDDSNGRELLALWHESAVYFAAYSPDKPKAFSPDKRKIVTASEDRTARVWDAATGAELAIMRGHEGPVQTAVFSPNGQKIVTASQDKTARLWNAASGASLAILRHESGVYSAVFSPDGQKVLTTSQDRIDVDQQAKTTLFLAIRVWDVANGRELVVLRHEGAITWAGYSPDGQKIITTQEDGTIRLWDAATGVELSLLKGRHQGAVSTVFFSPDGQRIVTASEDRTARVWDADTGVELAILRGHEGPVGAARFSPDGQKIATVSDDRTARVWDAATGVELAVLRGHEGPVR